MDNIQDRISKAEAFNYYRISTDFGSRVLAVHAGQLEEVLSQHDHLEHLVGEEHVDGAGVCELPRVVGDVLDAAVLVLAARVLLLFAERGHEISSYNCPKLSNGSIV